MSKTLDILQNAGLNAEEIENGVYKILNETDIDLSELEEHFDKCAYIASRKKWEYDTENCYYHSIGRLYYFFSSGASFEQLKPYRKEMDQRGIDFSVHHCDKSKEDDAACINSVFDGESKK